MSHQTFQGFKKLLLLYLSVLCILFASYSAYAINQNVADGCDPKVMDATQKKAAAKLAASIAVMEELMTQPRSVLELSCFNKMASVAAKKACDIFSGDCTTEIKDLLYDALRMHYANFPGKSQDDSNKVDFTADKYECAEMKKAWEAEENSPTPTSVPSMIVDADLQSDTPPQCKDASGGLVECGEDFRKSWEASANQNIFKDYKEAALKLVPPDLPSGTGCDGKDGVSGVVSCYSK